MGCYVANQIIKLMIKKGQQIAGSKVLMLGITFKENCPDIRNSRVIDVIEELQDFGAQVDIYDPWANPQEVEQEYGIMLNDNIDFEAYQTIVLAVAHDEFKQLNIVKTKNQVIFDIKSFLEPEIVDGKL